MGKSAETESRAGSRGYRKHFKDRGLGEGRPQVPADTRRRAPEPLRAEPSPILRSPARRPPEAAETARRLAQAQLRLHRRAERASRGLHHGAGGGRPGCGARPVEEAGWQRRRLHDRGPGEDLRGLPFHQNLLPPPGLEPRLRPGQGARPEGGRRADSRRGPPGRPAPRPVGSAGAAHAATARGPRQLQAAGPLPAGDPRPALPRRLQPRPAGLAGQVSEPRDLSAGPPLSLNRGGGACGGSRVGVKSVVKASGVRMFSPPPVVSSRRGRPHPRPAHTPRRRPVPRGKPRLTGPLARATRRRRPGAPVAREGVAGRGQGLARGWTSRGRGVHASGPPRPERGSSSQAGREAGTSAPAGEDRNCPGRQHARPHTAPLDPAPATSTLLRTWGKAALPDWIC